MLPLESFKIGLSKMQFPAFPGPELINWKGVSLFVSTRNAHKQWNTILFLQFIIII